MKVLGKLEEIRDLRTVWPHEALDFTPWLAKDENITLLGDALDLDITVDETESSVGDFHVDILASETGTDRKIIIENQLEDTNHDHLGKLITYAAGKSADLIIWVVRHAREEHRAAIEWLNNHTEAQIGFFLCEVKLYRIGNSDPAVKFEVIEKPNDWMKETKISEGTSETQQQRYEYWAAFQEYAFRDAEFAKSFRRRKPSKDAWLDFGIGFASCHITISRIPKRNSLRAELYINGNKEVFRMLLNHKKEIEQNLGLSLNWREMPNNKASRISVEKIADFSNESQWPSQFDWLMDTMIRMKNVFSKYLTDYSETEE